MEPGQPIHLGTQPGLALHSGTESFLLEFPVRIRDTNMPMPIALVNKQGRSGNVSCLFSLLWSPSQPEHQPWGKEKLFPHLERGVGKFGRSGYTKGGSVQNQLVLGLD